MEEFTDIYEFAEALHDFHCKSNHTDACDWYYRVNTPGKWEIKYSAHNSYLKYAQNLREELADMNPEQILLVLKSIKAAFRTPYVKTRN